MGCSSFAAGRERLFLAENTPQPLVVLPALPKVALGNATRLGVNRGLAGSGT